ncbi:MULTISPECIES: hypothetical protein [unclassified Streptomyces]|uniref:hypothetical protein n=1 Tax=unclassified Streptomyces TaxID=2593676 RepID=UPI00382BC7C1
MSDLRLTYDVTPYVELGEQHAIIAFTCTAPQGGGTVNIQSISAVLPCGSADTDLLATAKDDNVSVRTPSNAWRSFTKTSAKTVEAGIRPKNKQQLSLEAGHTLKWYIVVPVITVPGTANLTLKEKTDKEYQVPLPLPKTSPGFHLGELQPQRYAIRAGETTSLTWSAKPKGYTLSSVLDYSTPEGPRKLPIPAGDTTTGDKLPPLTHSTSFRLQTSVTPPKGQGNPFAVPLTTFVTVSFPGLAATRLTARSTRLLQQPYNGGGDLTDYDRQWRTKPVDTTLPAATDGLLSITAQGETCDVTLTATLDHGSTTYHTMQLTTRDERDLLMPVPCGYTVHLSALCRDTAGKDHNYLLTLNWQPFGIGNPL